MPTEFDLIANSLAQGQLDVTEALLNDVPEYLQRKPRFHFLRAQLALKRKRYDIARAALADAESCDGELATALRIRANILVGEKDYPSARNCLTKLVRLFPRDGRLYLRLAGAQVECEDWRSAAGSLAAARNLGVSETLLLPVEARLLTRSGNTSELIAVLTRIIALDPVNSGEHRHSLSARLSEQGKLEEALRVNCEMDDHRMPSSRILWQRYNLFLALDRKEDGAATVSAIGRLAPDDLVLQCRIALILNQLGKGEEAWNLVSYVRKRWPTAPEGHDAALTLAVHQGRPAAELIQVAIAQADTAPEFSLLLRGLLDLPVAESDKLIEALCAKWPKQFGPMFGHSLKAGCDSDPILDILSTVWTIGRPDALAALAEYEASTTRQATAQPVELLREVITALPTPSVLRRGVIGVHSSDVIVSPRGTTGVTVVVFTGTSMRVGGYDPVVIDAICAGRGASAIYLRDYSLNSFLRGVRGIGSTREVMINGLRQRIASLGTKKLVVLTSSSGALGGVIAAGNLECDRIVMVSPVTGMTHTIFDASGLPHGAGSVLDRYAGAFRLEELDVLQSLSDWRKPLDVRVSYGSQSPFDVMQAERIGHLAGVSLLPVSDWSQHGTMPYLIANGDIKKLLFDGL